MQGGCIADIGSCGTGFDSASGSVRTKKFRTKGSELADRKGEKNKAMPRAPSICCSSIDEALSFSSRARCNKRLVFFPSREPAKLIFKTGSSGALKRAGPLKGRLLCERSSESTRVLRTKGVYNWGAAPLFCWRDRMEFFTKFETKEKIKVSL
uniref:Uncharacterized protein n=1 Tax=Stipa capillata TaxID=665498 RepID=A0A8F5V9H6_9POAL|nr:hypothetical protein [Stipa capillata]